MEPLDIVDDRKYVGRMVVIRPNCGPYLTPHPQGPVYLSAGDVVMVQDEIETYVRYRTRSGSWVRIHKRFVALPEEL